MVAKQSVLQPICTLFNRALKLVATSEGHDETMNIFAGNFESAKKLLIFLLTVVAVLAFGASRAFAEETGGSSAGTAVTHMEGDSGMMDGTGVS